MRCHGCCSGRRRGRAEIAAKGGTRSTATRLAQPRRKGRWRICGRSLKLAAAGCVAHGPTLPKACEGRARGRSCRKR